MAGRAMTSTPLTRKARGGGGLAVVEALKGGDSSGIKGIPLRDIAPNPDNPGERLEDLDGLVASVLEVGVIVPLTVASAADHLAAHPEHAATVAGRPWVLRAGHRRHAAATRAGLEEVPAWVIDGAVAGERGDEAILHENLHRQALTPIQEGEAFARILERRGISQRDLAKHIGVSQAQISKRLALLTLPIEIQRVVGSGVVPVIDALTLGEAEPEVVATVAQLLAETPARAQEGLPTLTRTASAMVLGQRRRERAELVAQERSGRVVDYNTLTKEFQGRHWDYRLNTEREIKAAQKRGDLIVVPNTDSWSSSVTPLFYRAADPQAAATKPTRSAHEQKRLDDEKGRKAGMKARRAFLPTLLVKPSAATIAHVTSLALIGGEGLDAQSAEVARKVAAAAKFGPATEAAGWEWRQQIVGVAQADRPKMAYLVALACLEDRASWTNTTWATSVTEYFDHLVASGYEPTPWEKALYDRSVKAHAKGENRV